MKRIHYEKIDSTQKEVWRKLENGIVSFDFIASNGESCIVSFSQSMQQMYKIRFFSEKEVEQKERDHSKHNGIIVASILK